MKVEWRWGPNDGEYFYLKDGTTLFTYFIRKGPPLDEVDDPFYIPWKERTVPVKRGRNGYYVDYIP